MRHACYLQAVSPTATLLILLKTSHTNSIFIFYVFEKVYISAFFRHALKKMLICFFEGWKEKKHESRVCLLYAELETTAWRA